MYELFYTPGKASLAVHWMLIELGVPFELHLVDFHAAEQKHPKFLKLNPAGQVPVLVVDGQPCTQSTALLMLLAERHPEARFAAVSAPDRAAYLETMIYLANELLPAFRAWAYVGDFAGPPHHEDSLAHTRARIEGVFARLDEMLSDGRAYLLGPDLTAPDFLTVMLSRWSRRMPRPADSSPHLGAYLARLKQRPGLREVHAREGLTDWL